MRARPKGNRKLPEGRRREGDKAPRVAALGAILGRAGALFRRRRRGRRRAVPSPVASERDPRGGGAGPRGFLWVWGLAVALAAASFVFHLSVRFDIIQTGYALSRAQGEQRRLRLSQRELRLELATLKAPGRIEQQAREELGMVRPDHEQTLRVGSRSARLALRRR